MNRDSRKSRASRAACVALAAAFVALGAGCSRRQPGSPAPAPAEAPLAELSVDDVAGRVARREPLVVFDVNRHERYVAGHVPGARWAKFNEITTAVLPADRATPLVFYCASET